MRILVVANVVPMPDQSAGWLRFFRILRVMAEDNSVLFHPVDFRWQEKYYGDDVVRRFQGQLERLEIRVTDGSWGRFVRLMRDDKFDIVFFEHWATVRAPLLREIRYRQPKAVVVVDTVDVEFQRLYLKAALTKSDEDRRLAEQTKNRELGVYGSVDVVLAVGEADTQVLLQEKLPCRIEGLPLMYEIQPLLPLRAGGERRTVLFVAHFDHDANVDAIVHFCEEILPLVVAQVPDARLLIVGRSPPSAVLALAGPGVEVLGFVSDLSAVYAASDVAIAPMRYGGGLKGKIVEAMSYGLPVVTNSVSLRGFSAVSGRDVLVGDTPEAFAAAVVALFRDSVLFLYERVREAGWQFARENFSEEVVGARLKEVLARALSVTPRKMRVSDRLWRRARDTIANHILWRFRA